MRRPAVCGSVDPVEDCFCSEEVVYIRKGESRLVRMKRLLTGSLLMGRRGKIFGLKLEELPAENDGVPKIVVRLCNYIELHGSQCGGLFRLSAGNPKLVERLRMSFDRNGDADLEGAADAASVASLLKLWLRELPEPVIETNAAIELLQIQEKFHEERTQWLDAVCQTLKTLPIINIRLLCYLLRFLHHYNQRVMRYARCNHHTSGGVAAIFSSLLLEPALENEGRIFNVKLANGLMNKLINEANSIIRDCKNGNARVEEDRNLKEEVVSSPYSLPQDHVPMQQRKKREHQEILVLQLQDRKVTRSSSEERPLEEGGSNNKDNIRRVSSHEDFSKTRESSNKVKEKKNKINGPHQDFLTKMKENMHHETLPLGEHNSSDAVQPHVINDFGPKFAPCVDHGKASVSPAEILEDTAHEKRRNKERFFHSSTARGRRNVIHHRKKIHKSSDVNASQDSDGGESMKENKIQYDSAPSSKHHGSCVISSYDDDSSQAASSCSSSSPSFLQICTEEKDTSPTPSCSSTTPPLDLSTLHQQVDSSEPQTSLGNWSFSHFSPEEETECSRVMLSPRSSMVLTQRMYLDPSVPPSPPQEHNIPGRGSTESKNSITESRIKQLTKEMNSLKKKLKRYEEEFEKQNGYRPSHADKLANKDIKKVCSEITIIRKDLKCLKENSEVSFLHSFEKSLYHTSGSISSKSKPRTMEETLRDVEKHLVEKRKIAGRPEDVDQLTREQVIEEKVSLQKALLYMENLYGRPVTKEDRDMVRPLYDRYRVLKRLMIRFGSSKLKDSMSELATILEHETMDFTNSPTGSLNVNNENDSVTIQPLDPVPSSDALWENLHSLPLSELLEQQRATKEEKKQLRRTLREFEEDFQRKTGKKLQKDDHTPIDNIYSSYKQAKAKLRLLEALVTKQT